MTAIGSIDLTYQRDGVEVVDPLLYIKRDGSFHNPFFIHPKQLRGEVGDFVKQLAVRIEDAVSRIYELIEPIFGYKTADIFQDVLRQSTHFNCPRTYKKRFGDDSVGIHYDRRIKRRNKNIPRGAHIEMATDLDELEAILYHEWGHEFHRHLCKQRKLPHPFGQYDDEMTEAAAIMFERLVADDYDKFEPHKTAYDLVHTLEWHPLYGELPFDERLLEMLQFKKHRKLLRFLEELESIR